MYAIVKTGGKQYKVAPGDVVSVEKLPAEVGEKVQLTAICVVDGDKIVADPSKACDTPVTAEVIEQYKGKKQLVFKFKKRKNYKKLQGHRQKLTRLYIETVGSETKKREIYVKAADDTETIEEVVEEVVEQVEEVVEEAIEEAVEEIEEVEEIVEEVAEEAAEAAEEAAEEVAE